MIVVLKYTPLIKKAMRIAEYAHRGQFDRGGYPYIHHPLHIAEQMEDEYTCAAALLHDVVEDSDFTVDDLRVRGIPEPVLEAVALMTRQTGYPYMDYICDLSENKIARTVKIADLCHNMDVHRLEWPLSEQDERRRVRYKKAARFLKNVEIRKRDK